MNKLERDSMIGLCVWHVNPDNITYVGPYSSEPAARAAVSALGFKHYEADPVHGQEESWQADQIGGSEGVSISIEERDSFNFPPEQLVTAVHAVA